MVNSEKINELMVITSEECGELIQSSMKILRWGLDKKNHRKLLEELGDVQCMIDLIIEHNIITQKEIDARKNVKREKLRRYSNHLIK